MIRVWGILRKRHKIAADHVAEHDGEIMIPVLMECLQTLCDRLDIPRPVVLGKHERELMAFGRTRFKPSDFMEKVYFDIFRNGNTGR